MKIWNIRLCSNKNNILHNLKDMIVFNKVYLFYKLQVFEAHNMFKEALETVEFMSRPERKNPYPYLCFLIDDRIYHDTGTLLNDLKENYNNKLSTPIINLESLNFRF